MLLIVMTINVGGIMLFHHLGVIRRSVGLSHPVGEHEITVLDAFVQDTRFGAQLLRYLEDNPKSTLSKLEYQMAVNRHLSLHQQHQQQS